MGRNIDGVLVQWGDRLFYPSNRIVKPDLPPYLTARAAVIRTRIAASVRRAPQVIIKVTGGGRGMKAVGDHLRYICRGGSLAFENDRGTVREGKEALRDVVDEWRYGGRFIADVESRREALNLVLAMPAGTDADLVKRAVREFARIELAGHHYVMVLHEDQTSPHVHLCVKRESVEGQRLSIGTPGLKRWRQTFAERLRGWGVEAEATNQAVRGATRNFDSLWRMNAKDEGRLRTAIRPTKSGPAFERSRAEAMVCWGHILRALGESELVEDRQLAPRVADFLVRTPYLKDMLRKHPERLLEVKRHLEVERPKPAGPERSGPEWVR